MHEEWKDSSVAETMIQDEIWIWFWEIFDVNIFCVVSYSKVWSQIFHFLDAFNGFQFVQINNKLNHKVIGQSLACY